MLCHGWKYSYDLFCGGEYCLKKPFNKDSQQNKKAKEKKERSDKPTKGQKG
jgi:hypothetical protein